MLMRICLFVAIIAGLVVGGLNFVKVKEKITTLQSDLKRESDAHVKFEADYKRTRAELNATNAVLKQTQTELTATKEERDSAVAKAASEGKRADKLSEDLTKTRQERDSAQADLAAYKATGRTPEQIIAFNKMLKGLEDSRDTVDTENKTLLSKVKRLQNQLALYNPNAPPVYLRADLTGKVLVSDPKWNFVVLNVGENQGVLERGELLVNRNGKLVAKVIVTNVQKDRSVANVMPGWQLGEVFEGDQVIPANPES